LRERRQDMARKKKRKIAVALRYDKEKDKAPVIVASGRGRLAHQIVSSAEEHNVPVEGQPALAEALYKIKIGEEIPAEMYEAVAVLLSYIMESESRS